MPRSKLYPKEFLVRATAEELRLIDGLAREGGTSRSRLLVTAALAGGPKAPETLPLLEAMLEARAVALVELRRVRYRVERVADLLRLRPETGATDHDLAGVIKDLTATTSLLKKVWAP